MQSKMMKKMKNNASKFLEKREENDQTKHTLDGNQEPNSLGMETNKSEDIQCAFC